MSLDARDSGGGDFEPIAEAVHHAICTRIYDLGTQHNQTYNKDEHKVRITWELPNEIIEIDGEDLPRNISRKYTLSLGKRAHLRKDLEAWRGTKFTEKELADGFKLKKLLGQNCQLQIVHAKVTDDRGDEKTYANIAAIMALPKGTKKFNASNGTSVYEIEDGVNIPEDTPEWIKKEIMNSKEYKSMGETASRTNEQNDIDDSEIPF